MVEVFPLLKSLNADGLFKAEYVGTCELQNIATGMYILCITCRKDQHCAQICTVPLFYVRTPTCFGSSLPSSVGFLDPPELLEIELNRIKELYKSVYIVGLF
jgi:hypothetical protein